VLQLLARWGELEGPTDSGHSELRAQGTAHEPRDAGCRLVIVTFLPSIDAAQAWLAEVFRLAAASTETVTAHSVEAVVADIALPDDAAIVPFTLLLRGAPSASEPSPPGLAPSAAGAGAGSASTADAGGPLLPVSPSSAVGERPTAKGQALYRALGFASSIAGTWAPEALTWYAEQAAAGRELRSSRGMDVTQMGGDLVCDAAGRIVFSHYSASSRDRPETSVLLHALRSCESGRE